MVTFLVFSLMAAAALPGSQDYLAGVAAEREVRFGDAVKAYQACAAQEGPLAPYAQLRAAFCRSRAGDPDGAVADYRQLIDTVPEGPWTRMAQVYLASLYAERKQYSEAVPLFDAVVTLKPQLWWFDRYAARAADSRLALPGQEELGFQYFRQVADTATFWGPRREAADRLARSPEIDDKLAAAFALLRTGGRDEASKLLLELARQTAVDTLKPGSDDPVDTWALSWREGALAKFKDRWPWHKGGKANERAAKLARYWLAYTVDRDIAAGKLDKARLRCDALTMHCAGTEATAESLWRLAKRLERDDKEAEAAEQYLRLAKNCPDHFRADDALFAAGRLQMESGDSAAALTTLGELRKEKYADSPNYAAACYLSGLLKEKNGDKKAVVKDFSEAAQRGAGDYYAHRAYERLHEMGALKEEKPVAELKVDSRTAFLRPFPQDADAVADVPEALLDDPRYQRLFFFGQQGLEEGEWELLDIGLALQKTPNAASVYQAATESGFAYSALEFAQAFGWGMQQGKPTSARLRVAYPRAYWPQVEALGKEAGVDPFLILAVARQESTFRPGLTSSAGAQGVMQVMPATAEWLAKVEPNVREEHTKHLDVPLNSLRVGSYYLLRMIDQCDGNLVYALASYNAGPGNLKKWRDRFGNADLDTFIERIPFSETRGYVKAVLSNYAAYYSLYPPAK